MDHRESCQPEPERIRRDPAVLVAFHAGGARPWELHLRRRDHTGEGVPVAHDVDPDLLTSPATTSIGAHHESGPHRRRHSVLVTYDGSDDITALLDLDHLVTEPHLDAAIRRPPAQHVFGFVLGQHQGEAEPRVSGRPAHRRHSGPDVEALIRVRIDLARTPDELLGNAPCVEQLQRPGQHRARTGNRFDLPPLHHQHRRPRSRHFRGDREP